MKRLFPLLLTPLLIFLSFRTILFHHEVPPLGFLAWLGLIPLLVSLKEASIKEVFQKTFLSAFLFYGGTFYWIYNALHTFGHLSPVASFGTLIVMITAMTLYLAGAAALAQFLSRKMGFSFYMLLPWAWVVQDYCLNYFPVGGFSWGALAYTQGAALPLIQIADLGGPYLLTFVIVFFNASLARFFMKEEGRGRQLAFAILLVVATTGYGFYRISSWRPTNSSLKVALLQGNIPQDEKWQAGRAPFIEETYAEMMQAIPEADLAIWPEASYPYLLSLPLEKFPTKPEIFRFETLLGSVTQRGRERNTVNNSALLVRKGGEVGGIYHKVHLVPFGEYVPYSKFLFFLHKVVPEVGDFEGGKEIHPLSFEKGKLGLLVCYEDLFPEIARQATAQGADLLINISNDAWYGWTSAPIQHLELSRFRAVENRRSLVRATNTGSTAIIDPVGRMREAPLFQRLILQGEVALGGRTSFYTRFGDLFAWLAIFVVVGLIVAPKKRKRGIHD
ncbi:MAG: apolipoprotein N-acyltransferase [Deltaproteobacteria bacterium]|nr:apolipoprotein N-acyltransferase [Deltaproteobacteria bacterium]